VGVLRVEVIPYSLPFREPYVTARGRLDSRDLILLRLRGDEGIEALGEAAPLALRGGPGIEALVTDLEDRCRPLLERADGSAEGIGPTLAACRDAGASEQALAAADIALHDLAAKTQGLPVWRVLGAAGPEPVPCNATLSAGEPPDVARAAGGWAERGFKTFKLKLGDGGDDAGQVAAVRDALGGTARIRVDANGAWSVEEAMRTLEAIAPSDVELAEQPVATMEELATLRERSPVPIAADESVVTAADARRAAAMDACDAATVKLAKAGGILAALEVAEALPVYLSSALDGPVGIAAAAHTAQALPRAGFAADLAHGLATGELFDTTIASSAPALDGPLLRVGDVPGLGVEIDQDELRRRML
jgi:o-succinylbenzoate synthase